MGLALLRARFLDADAFQLALWDGAPRRGASGRRSTWPHSAEPDTTS